MFFLLSWSSFGSDPRTVDTTTADNAGAGAPADPPLVVRPQPHPPTVPRTADGALHIYQFGVFNGDSMRQTAELLKRLPEDEGSRFHFWGFDSFEGLPVEPEQGVSEPGHAEWVPGQFLPSLSIGEIAESIRKINPAKIAHVEMVKGFYNDTLALAGLGGGATTNKDASWRQRLKPAAYVDIDVDLYSSAKEVLGFLFANKIATVGTLIGYDDWIVHGCSKGGIFLHPLDSGEGRAHAEIAERFGGIFESQRNGVKTRKLPSRMEYVLVSS